MGLGYARTTQSATGRRAVGLWRVFYPLEPIARATPSQSPSSNRANERPFERQDDSPRLDRSIIERMSPHISIDRAQCRRSADGITSRGWLCLAPFFGTISAPTATWTYWWSFRPAVFLASTSSASSGSSLDCCTAGASIW